MIVRIHLICLAIVAPTPFSRAQTLPSVHATNGLRTTATVFRIERAEPRPSGPRSEAHAIRAATALEFGRLKNAMPDTPLTLVPASLIQRILPTFILPPTDPTIPDHYDAVFFGEAKVIRVRLHLQVAGQSLSKEWMARIRAYFDYLDRDRDGYLNAYEADMAFSPSALRQLLKTGSANPNLGESGRALAELDRDRDGRVSLDELTAYYLPGVKDLIGAKFNDASQDTVSQRLTDAMFKLFDRDRDGKLSRAELQSLEEFIPQLDQNDDECLTNIELIPDLFVNPVSTAVPPKGVVRPLQVWPTGTIPETIVEQLLHRYDKDKNLRIGKSENPFSDAAWSELDKNGDGELSLTEVMNWRTIAPDLSIEWTLAAQPADCRVKLLPGPDGKPAPLAHLVRIAETGRAFIRVGNQNLDLTSFSPASPMQDRANQFAPIFQQADPMNRGYYSEKELVGPAFQFLRVLFDVMDRDMDGRVSRAEFDAYFLLQSSFVDLPLTLQHSSNTPSLFQLLDTDHDNRLSIPELRAAWKQLKDLKPGGGEFVTRATIQPHGQLRLSRGNPILEGQPQPSTFNPANPQTKGPLWFRKMDRNGDGVISRSEFPGNAQAFDRLDANRDNLIDLEEAEAADKRMRPPEKK